MVKKAKKILFVLLALALCCLFGCEEVVDPPVRIVDVALSGPNSVVIGEQITLTATIVNSEETPIWSSSDDNIATVSDGVVTGIKEGNVDISVKVEDVTKTLSIKVKEKVVTNVSLFCGVNLETQNPKAYEKVELSVIERNPGYVKANYNPFDYDTLYVYGVFTSPSNKMIMAPAFWYRDYTITLNESMSTGKVKEGEPDGLEMVNWASNLYEYRLRFQPDEAGTWKYTVYVSVDGIITENYNSTIEVEESEENYKGLIQVDKSNNRTFMYQDGTSFMPIGENIGWWADNSRKTYDYQVWFENCNLNNMNIARIWLAPWGFCLHSKSMTDLSDRLNYAARLDRVIEYADQYDMYIILTLLNHGQFSAKTDPTWDSNPYNVANGGILSKPEQFFTSADAKKAYKNELLYILGRYGYSDNIMSWELFNEVDWTDNSDINAVNIRNWHQEMAAFIKNNDSYGHMVSTSYRTEYGAAFTLADIDFACPHSYGYANKNICDTLPALLDKLYTSYNKPILFEEIGINWENGISNYRLDPTGISLRQASWAGMLGGGCGGAMNWWWDSYVHPYDLYYQFKGAGAYAKLMDLSGSDYTQLRTLDGVSVKSGVGIIGYRYNNRVYGYVYDQAWKYNKTTFPLSDVNVSIPFTNGTYNLKMYDTVTGELLTAQSITVSDGVVRFTVSSNYSDAAFIIE